MLRATENSRSELGGESPRASAGGKLTQGMLSACIGIGNGFSNLLAGFVAQKAGYNVGFLTLTAIALGALAFFWFFVPETKEQAEASDKATVPG